MDRLSKLPTEEKTDACLKVRVRTEFYRHLIRLFGVPQRPAWVVICIILASPVFVGAQVGDVTAVHDPSIIQNGGTFYLFSTGRGLSERISTDLFHWKRAGRVLSASPGWTRDYIPPFGSMWAPDISLVDGEYRLYYAVSVFGKTSSAIGLSINKTLDATSPDYHWIDRGKVISTPAGNRWNAIDPCAFEDAQGNSWMVLGSCWTGLKLVQMDRRTGLLADPSQEPISVAAHPPTNIIEEGYIRRHGDYYYLWESVDYCCRGVDSTYRILVGRSKEVRGPYLDRDGNPMLRGGGTLVLASYDHVRGPGSCAILPFANRDYLIHHEYDADNRGTPTLQIRPLFWADDGWPVAGLPITRPPAEKPSVVQPVPGNWDLRYDFGDVHQITLQDNGSISPGPGKWIADGTKLKLVWSKAAKEIVEQCSLSEDGTYFVGRTDDGLVINGKRK